MRGQVERQAEIMFTMKAEDVVPADHPLRRIRVIADGALQRMSAQLSEKYSRRGRRSVPPEHLLKASLLMALYSIPSERQLCEQLRYNLLYKWFLDLNIQEEPFDPTSFSQNRKRILNTEVASEFLAEVVMEAIRRGLLSSEHFTVDGTLIEAWASIKSFVPRTEDDGSGASSGGSGSGEGKGRDSAVDFHGQRRSNETHVSKTDPQSRLARKGNNQPAKLSYTGHVLMENRHGIMVDAMLTQATGTAERDAAIAMVKRYRHRRKRVTLGADKGYDTRQFVNDCREAGVTPHVAQNTSRRKSAIDKRTTHHPGYAVSQRLRKRVEEGFGWAKTVGGTRKLRYLGVAKNEFWFKIVIIAFDLVRMGNIQAKAGA